MVMRTEAQSRPENVAILARRRAKGDRKAATRGGCSNQYLRVTDYGGDSYLKARRTTSMSRFRRIELSMTMTDWKSRSAICNKLTAYDSFSTRSLSLSITRGSLASLERRCFLRPCNVNCGWPPARSFVDGFDMSHA
jgi:hypothetical protein